MSEDWIEDMRTKYEETIAALKAEVDIFKKAEKELSDAYLRIRQIVGAWDTNHAGENRYEVTENKIKALSSRAEAAEEEVERLKGECKRIEFGYNHLLSGQAMQDMIAERDKLLADNAILRAALRILSRRWRRSGIS